MECSMSRRAARACRDPWARFAPAEEATLQQECYAQPTLQGLSLSSHLHRCGGRATLSLKWPACNVGDEQLGYQLGETQHLLLYLRSPGDWPSCDDHFLTMVFHHA